MFVNENASLSVLRGRIEKNAGGRIAVQLTSAADLSVTDSFISQNGARGIGLGGAPGSGNLSAGISRNVITDNSDSGIIAHSAIPTSMVKTISITDNVIQSNSAGYGGISIFAMPGETVTAVVTNNVVVNNAPNGILAGGSGATVIADANVVSRSNSGLTLQESAAMKSLSNNAVEINGADVSGSLTALAPR